LTEIDRWILLGTIAKAHGVHGYLKINLHQRDYPFKNLPLHFRIDSASERIFLECNNIRQIHDGLLVQLHGITSRDQAILLRGSKIWVSSHDIADADVGEFYVFELLGMRVRTEDHDELGVVKQIYDNQGQSLMAIDCHGRELLVPLTKGICKQLDREKNVLTMEIPKDLLEIYLVD